MVLVHTALDIDDWGRGVAVAEADALRDAVRDALLAGAGLAATLALVRRRMSSLTAEQREVMIESIDLAGDHPAR